MTRRWAALALAAAVAAGAVACGGGPEDTSDEPGGAEGPAPALDSPGVAAERPAPPPDGADVEGSPSGESAAAGGGTGEAAARPEPPPPAADPVTLTGTVHLSGTAQAPMLTLSTPGGSWVLRGEREDELRRLDGATVRVTGQPAGSPGRLRPFEVTSYQVESIAGRTPFVGRVERGADGGLVLVAEGATLPLRGAGDLADAVGARVWVLGEPAGDALSVSSYGIIRPAG